MSKSEKTLQEIFKSVPKSSAEGLSARFVENSYLIFTRNLELINTTKEWAEITLKLDQEWRQDERINTQRDELRAEFSRLDLDISKWAEFLKSDPVIEDEISLKNRLEAFLDEMNTRSSDKLNQDSLRLLLKKIGGFPSMLKYGRDVANTAWLVFQHADNDVEFQKQGLELMYNCRRQNPNQRSVELTHFYYLTDRITVALNGYQFFGTQKPNTNLIALPETIKPYFNNNPAYFCNELVKIESLQDMQTIPTDSEMYSLWSLAARDSLNFGFQNIQAVANVAKYKNPTPQNPQNLTKN